MTIRLPIADDHEVTRAGVKSMLEGSNIQVIAEVCRGNEAVEQVVKHRPDVVLLDVRMPECDSLRALERIIDRSPGTKSGDIHRP